MCSNSLVDDIDSLITVKRMDIIVNLIYCRFYDKNIKSTFAKDLYINQKKSEKGDDLIEQPREVEERSVSTKKGENDWIEKFNYLIDCVKNDTFVWEEKRAVDMITISKKSNQLVRGAHRVAVHYYFNKNIYAAYNNESHHKHELTQLENYDYIFNEFINLKKDTLTFCLFPKFNTKQNDDFVTNTINADSKINLLYKKNIKLNETGFIYFLIILYQIHDINGVGSLDYNVIRRKLKESFKEDSYTTVYFIEKEKECNRKHLVNLKKNIIRKYLDSSERSFSFHVCDNHVETKNISQFVLNNKNIQFANLNNIAKFNCNYPSLDEIKNEKNNKKIDVKKITKDVFIDSEDYCVVGSKLLSLLGIRNSKDIDIVTKNLENNSFDIHNEYIPKYMDIEPDEIIYDPNNYFYFFNVKFISPNVLLKFKQCRYSKTHDKKDKNDIKDLESIVKKLNVKQ